MKQLDLKEYIRTSDEISALLQAANVGNIAREKMTLKEMLHFELLKFAIYLADADGDMDERELEVIRTTLGIDSSIEELTAMRKREIEVGKFGEKIPSVLKYPVLADAAHKISPDPYRGQKAMVFYDTFKLFGETILAVHKEEADEMEVARFTEYVYRMENFIKSYGIWYAGDNKIYRPIEPAIEETAESQEEKAAKLEELLSEFNGLTGLTGVKHQVNSLVNLMRVQKMREQQGLKVSDVTKHMVFSGNPGTGKTTVARMLAEIYKYLGVLTRGQLVEVDRGGLVKGFIGQTATRVQEVVDEALGGILFIDEAYTLTVGKGDGDFGQEAVDTLLKSMEDHRDELIVIVAGYTDLMEQFLNSNPGLKSRFSNFIFFEDYTADELMDILHKNLEKQEYVLSKKAEKKARQMIEERVANKPDNFANARDVRNFMEHAISNHATRVVEIENADSDKSILSTLEVEDLQPFDENM
ncbi:MAG: AAA family ATPase [Lachnospiraceae bacterium]|nr:AAA family ATPase [Lachnospiraceae bacterium]